MKKISMIMFAMFLGLALMIGGSVVLSVCFSDDLNVSEEESDDNAQVSATIPTRAAMRFNANGGTLTTKRALQINSISVTNFSYGFSVNTRGWFESQNQGVNNSYSMMKIRFYATSNSSFTIRYISHAENNFDYAIFGNLDQVLSQSYNVDSTYYKSTNGEASPDEKSITYSSISSGYHEIYIKFRKDGSNHYNNDSLQLFFESDCETGGNKWQFQGMMIGTLPYATRRGYSFAGWWTSAEGGEYVTPYSIHNNGATVYAHWEGAVAVTAPIYFDENHSDSNPNLLNTYSMVVNNGNLVEQDGRWTSKTISGNLYSGIKIHRLQNDDWGGDLQAKSFATPGRIIHTIDKTEANCKVRIGFNGNNTDATLMIDISSLQNGSYTISAYVYSFSGESATGGTFGEIKIERGSSFSGYSPEYRLTYVGSGYEGDAFTDLPTPAREGYTFNGWYRKKNYLDMDAMMGYFNSFDPYAKIEKLYGRVYSWSGQTAYLGNSGSGDTYRLYNPGGFEVGGTYRVSYMAKNPTEDLLPTTALIPYKSDGRNGVERNGDNIYNTLRNEWLSISYTFVVPSDFGGFSCTWYHGNRTEFKDIWVERVDISDFETKVTTSTKQPFIFGHTLYASWSANAYSVSFNGNGSTSGSMSSRTWTYDNWYSVSNLFTRQGYSFSGWTISTSSFVTHYYGTSTSNYSTTANSSFTHNLTGTGYYKNLRSTSGTVTFTAKWTPYQYTVTFNGNGGSVSQTSKPVTFDSPYGTLPEPSRTYYEFGGWWTAASGGTQVTKDTTYSTVGNQTLYAHWTPTIVRHHVYLRLISADGKTVSESNDGGSVNLQWYLPELDSQGNSILTEEEIFTSDVFNAHQGQALRMTARAKSGYAFVGFSTSSTPSEAIKNPSSAPSTTATYYPTANTDYYVYFKQLSGNQLKYDETDKYFYFEDGYYPQSEARQLLFKEKLSFNGLYNSGAGIYYFKENYNYKIGEKFIFSVRYLGGSVVNGQNADFFIRDVAINSKSLVESNGMLVVSQIVNSEFINKFSDIAVGMYANTDGATFNNFEVEVSLEKDLSGILDSSAIKKGENFKYCDGENDVSIPVYSYGGDRFVRISKNGETKWFKFEPIRWRISDYGVAKTERNIARYTTLLKFKNYASFSDNFVAVSDLILSVGSMSNTREVREGDSVQDLTGFQNVQNLTDDLTNDSLKLNYNKTGNIINVDQYSGYGSGQTNAVNKNNEISYSAPFRITSLAELSEVGLINRGAKASDMVAFILGQDKNQVSYWTRDLSNLGSGIAITPTGTQIQPWLDEMLGMRFSYSFKEGSAGGGRIDYETLNYIESSGAQYIDTGVYVGPKTSFVADWQFTNTNQQARICGGVGDFSFVLYISGGDVLSWACGDNPASYNWSSVKADKNRHTFELNAKTQKFLIDNGNTFSSDLLDAKTKTATQTLTLFTQKEANGKINGGAYALGARLYSTRLYDDDLLVRDFVPVRNVYTGEVGLWDNVTQRFYGNLGTGSFLAG